MMTTKTFKPFIVDLGGRFPAKMEAVLNHAKDLGVIKDSPPILLVRRFIRFTKNGGVSLNPDCFDPNDYRGEPVYSADRFLELKGEDIFVKLSKAKFWFMWVADGDGVITAKVFHWEESYLRGRDSLSDLGFIHKRTEILEREFEI